MGIDLKRLYYGATAFLVFFVMFLAALILSDETGHLILAANVPIQERRQIPEEVLPLHPPATAAPVVAPGQPTPIPPPTLVPPPTLAPEQREEVLQKERARLEDWELRSAKEGVASSLAVVLVALPIWWFHWRRWRALTQTDSAQLFRVYVYALMLIALIVAVLRGGYTIGRIVGLLLGAVDFSSGYATFTFARELAGGITGALIALLAWWYHWTAVRADGGDNQ